MVSSAKGLRYAVFETKAGWMGVLASAKGVKILVLPQPSEKRILKRLRLIRTDLTYTSEEQDRTERPSEKSHRVDHEPHGHISPEREKALSCTDAESHRARAHYVEEFIG